MKQFQRSHEPIAWSLFGAGGMVVAFIIPALVLVSGLILPGMESSAVFGSLLGFAQGWIGKVFIFITISLTLYHTVHRIYHGLHDLHIKGNNTLMLVLFYGSATLLSILCFAWLLVI